ncbi:MAG: DNA gyrase inhibitor YacG [Deltaproteobacteria bacterium]|nr:DNA gyrase inhibitor YacG [Deltaproteobacteria bacterium]
MKTQPMCPICKRALAAGATASEAFPFCSKRCKLVDLGAWLDGAYRIPGEPIADDGEGVLAQLTSHDGGDA